MTTDEKYMQRCIELALKGAGNVSPNPMVGCVIVKNGKVISDGYHKKYGENHAERNAINAALRKKINLTGAELYVNLEPCAHFGKTPPCADYISQYKFKRVIIGVKDPYHLVSGRGIRKLKKAGIKVIVGVLENECKEINKFFFKFVKTGLPFVSLKTAQTMDGFIANSSYRSKWISSVESRRLVHRLRAVYDAVLVGSNTVKHDNPELSVRLAKGRNPYRVVIDPKLESSAGRKIFNGGRTIVFCSTNVTAKNMKLFAGKGVRVIKLKPKNGLINPKNVLRELAKLNITSVIVEGGSLTYAEFIKNRLVDEFLIFIAPKIMGSGIKAFRSPLDFGSFKNISYYKTGSDILVNISKS